MTVISANPDEPIQGNGIEKYLAGFEGSIEPVKVPFLYKAGLLIVAIGMVLLPLVYIALIGLVGYGIYYHVTEDTAILAGSGGGIYRLLVYLGPVVIGGILTFFMIKPLFRKSLKMAGPLNLEREKEPLLFQFVEQVARKVGAPVPKSIAVNCDVNAFASFRRGWLSFFGNDLALTIGLPLTAGLNLRQLGGVLAHELGHFSQGAGMRLTYIIRSINYWFARIVSEKGAVSAWLDQGAEKTDIRIGIVLLIAKFFVGLTSRILWGLMMFGNFISSFMMRQMEFDADRYEIRLAGSSAFAATALRLRHLGASFQYSHSVLQQAWSERKLADNLPKLTLFHLQQMPPEVQKQIESHIQEEKTGYFDTHPSDKDRIANANKENREGIFQIEEPAAVLFSDFDSLSQKVTSAYYQEMLGESFTSARVISTSELLHQQDVLQEGYKVLARFFQGKLSIIRPVLLDEITSIEDVNRASSPELLKTARERMMETLPATKIAIQEFAESDAAKEAALQAKALLECGFTINPSEFKLTESTVAAAEQAYQDAKTKRNEAVQVLQLFENYAANRLRQSLLLIRLPDFAKQVPDADEEIQECLKLIPIYVQLNEIFPEILKLRSHYFVLSVLLHNLPNNEKNQNLLAKIDSIMRYSHEILGNLHQKFVSVMYPFEHAAGDVSLTVYLMDKLPEVNDWRDVYYTIQEVMDRFFDISSRILSRFAIMAEKVEAAIGLPPLPEVKPDAEKN